MYRFESRANWPAGLSALTRNLSYPYIAVSYQGQQDDITLGMMPALMTMCTDTIDTRVVQATIDGGQKLTQKLLCC